MNYLNLIRGTVLKMNQATFAQWKDALAGQYIVFSVIAPEEIDQEIMAEKLCDYFEKAELKNGKSFEKFVEVYLVFLGNPGTGKTTVARLIAKLYRQLGVLEKGQLIEVDRGGLVAGYVGQTALKTQEKIDEAMGGVLFIDEAYTLAKGGSDFGQEAIDTILKAMEDKRDSFVVIVAGYSEPMERFLESNPGLKSRFNKNIIFEDYSRAELISILKSFCAQNDMALTTEAEQDIDYYLEWLISNKPDNFANGREMRNLFETMYSNQANRLADELIISDDALTSLTVADLPQFVLERSRE